jgi:hypothetical protein
MLSRELLLQWRRLRLDGGEWCEDASNAVRGTFLYVYLGVRAHSQLSDVDGQRYDDGYTLQEL